MGTLSLGTKAPKLVGKLSEKLEKLFDKKKGTSKKITEKQKKQLQKNIDANKGKVIQSKKRASNLKKKQTKSKVETSTKLAPKEQIDKFNKQQQNIKKLQSNKAKQNRAKKQSKSKAKTGFVLQGKVVDKTPKLPIKKKESKALTVINKPKNKNKNLGSGSKKTKTDVKKLLSMKSSNIFSKAPKKKTGNIISRNKKKLAALAVAGTLPFAIDTEDSKVKSKNKDIKKIQSLKKETAPKINKPKTSKVDVKKLSKVKSDDYTGRFIDKDGNVAYDSPSDFLKHMFGTPKKRTMPKKYKRITPATKGQEKGVKFKKLSAGGNLKSLPPKSENPGIHKLPAKVKMNMGFKPMFGGGLVSSFYDKAEKTEKHKGNSSVARQVKGYGKAKKKT